MKRHVALALIVALGSLSQLASANEFLRRAPVHSEGGDPIIAAQGHNFGPTDMFPGGTGCCERESGCCDNIWAGYCESRVRWCDHGFHGIFPSWGPKRSRGGCSSCNSKSGCGHHQKGHGCSHTQKGCSHTQKGHGHTQKGCSQKGCSHASQKSPFQKVGHQKPLQKGRVHHQKPVQKVAGLGHHQKHGKGCHGGCRYGFGLAAPCCGCVGGKHHAHRPKLHFPKIHMPKIHMPKIHLPKVGKHAPKLHWPKLPVGKGKHVCHAGCGCGQVSINPYVKGEGYGYKNNAAPVYLAPETATPPADQLIPSQAPTEAAPSSLDLEPTDPTA